MELTRNQRASVRSGASLERSSEDPAVRGKRKPCGRALAAWTMAPVYFFRMNGEVRVETHGTLFNTAALWLTMLSPLSVFLAGLVAIWLVR